MALLPRGGSGSGSGGDGSGGCCGPEEININMTGCCDGDGDGGGGGSGGGGGGVSVHNELDGLQGGKSDEYFHLTEAEYRRLPIRPVVMSPKNGAAGVNQVPQIVGSPYAHPYDVPMRAKHCQIATDAAFANAVWEEEAFSASVVWQVLLKPDNTPYVQPNTKYFVRIRYQDRLGRWSDWSEASAFTTMAAFPANVILRPMMLMPAADSGVPPVNPILAMSSPKMIAGSANFDAADWQVSNEQAFASPLYSAAGSADVTTHRTSGLNLATALGEEFYARGRQRTSTGDWSDWAEPVRFHARPDYDDPIFGMRRIFSKKYGRPYVWTIDQDGEQVYIPPAYFDAHPLYAFPVQDIPIGDTGLTSNMAFVPPCWIKYRVYDNEDGDLTIDMWFSATAKTGDGWMLHPAFAGAQDGFWHGTCLASSATAGGKSYAVSKPDVAAATGTSPWGNIQNNQAADNTWHVYNIYEQRLLLDLMMAEYVTIDPSKVSGGSGRGNTTSSFMWRKFRGLANAGMYVTMAGVLAEPVGANPNTKLLLSTPNMGSVVPLDVSLPNGSGVFVTDIARGAIPELGFDVALLGIPSRGEASAGQASNLFGAATSLNLATSANKLYGEYDPDGSGLFLFGYRQVNGSCVTRVSKRA